MRYSSKNVVVANETPMYIVWCPSRVVYADLTPEFQSLVKSAWKSPNRRRKLKNIGKQLEFESAWDCTCSLVSWEQYLEYEVYWTPTDETLSNLHLSCQRSLIAKLEAEQYKII